MNQTLSVFIISFLLGGCGIEETSFEEKSIAVDTSAVTETIAVTDPNKLLTASQIDSIQLHLKNAGIEQMPKGWEMLTEQDGELIVFIPGGGETTRMTLRKDSVYLWNVLRMQESVDYLIVDYKKTENGFLLKILHPIVWPYSIEKSEYVKQLAFGTFSVNYTDKAKGLTKWNGADFSKNTLFVDSTFKKSYKIVEEPSPYE